MKQKIGIFGGTFDPPHLGHFALATAALQQLGLTKVLWLITPDSPFKTGNPKTPIEHRIAMVRSAIASQPAFEICLAETERQGPHYTIDTLKLLVDQYAQVDLVLLIGGDSLSQFSTWKDPLGILEIVTEIGALYRPGDETNADAAFISLPQLRQKTVIIQRPPISISSSDIRHRVSLGEDISAMVDAAVMKYIRKEHLYLSGKVKQV